MEIRDDSIDLSSESFDVAQRETLVIIPRDDETMILIIASEIVPAGFRFETPAVEFVSSVRLLR